MNDVNQIAQQLAHGRTLEELRDRMAGNVTATPYQRPAEKAESELAYWQRVYGAKPERKARAYIPAHTQDLDYEEARKALWGMVLDRGVEIAAAKNLPYYEIKFDQEQAAVIRNLLKWLINDPTSTLPLAKGVWLFGEPGTFKTEIMQILSSFSMARKLSKAFHFVDWSLEYDKFLLDGVPMSEQHKQFNRCFDEFLKKTEDVKKYGNVTNPNESIIEARYRRFKNYGQKTLFVSNFSPVIAQQQLSTQAFDRLSEMVSSILMPGNSKRNG